MDHFGVRWLFFLSLTILYVTRACQIFSQKKFAALSTSKLREITDGNSENDLREVFQNINIVRQVDTYNHTVVAQYISSYLSERGWTVEWDNFTLHTVIGTKTFRNIIASLSPSKHRFLVLACHYDSKLIEGFVGSIDSALPCSIILKVADSVTSLIGEQTRNEVGLRLVFFDGEEAFHSWTRDDSLYGSKHLGLVWSQLGPDGGTELSKIDLFVLLDLIGHSDLTLPRYDSGSTSGYQQLVSLERQFAAHKLLRNCAFHEQRYFVGHSSLDIQDDHLPFLNRGVPVVHLIPSHFPVIWHTVLDDAAHIDWNVSMDILNIIDAFVRSRLHLL